MLGCKDEFRRRAAIKDAGAAAEVLGQAVMGAAERQLAAEKRIEILEGEVAAMKKAIGELLVDNETLRKQLRERFGPIHEALAKLDPAYKPPKPKEGNGT